MFKRQLIRQPLSKNYSFLIKNSSYGLNNRRSLMSFRFFSEKPAEKDAKDEKTESNDQSSEPKQSENQQEDQQEPVNEWKLKFEDKDRELAKTKDLYLRSVADFRNLQETTKREIQKAKDYALQKFAKDLLESADNMDRALTAVPESSIGCDDANKDLVQLHEGISMVKSVFEKTLAKHGLVKLDPIGEKFDPNVHEATFEVPQPDKEPGTIFHVQQTGFALHGRVIRAPKVGVVKGN